MSSNTTCPKRMSITLILKYSDQHIILKIEERKNKENSQYPKSDSEYLKIVLKFLEVVSNCAIFCTLPPHAQFRLHSEKTRIYSQYLAFIRLALTSQHLVSVATPLSSLVSFRRFTLDVTYLIMYIHLLFFAFGPVKLQLD